MEKQAENKVIYINQIIDFFIVGLLVLLSIKKGGFYKSDTILFNLAVQILAGVKIFIYRLKEKNNFDIISVLLLLLSICYTLPIIFGNYANLSDSIFEMIRYFNVFLIYNVVKYSNNKKVFEIGCIVTGVILCVIGIDGLGERYLENFLNLFNSGYLDIDLTRMSSSIQYANVLSLFLLITSVFIFNDIKNIEFEKIDKKYIFNFSLYFILISSVFLTMSRMVIGIYLIYSFVTILKNNKLKIWLFYIFQSILLVSYNIIIQNIMSNNPSYIYLVVGIFVTLSCIVALFLNKLISKYINNRRLKVILNKKNIVCIAAVSIVGIAIYVLIGLNIGISLKISEYSKDSVKRDIYDFSINEINKIDINIKELEPDSRYKINIFEVKNDGTLTLQKNFNYYDKTTSSFNLQIKSDLDTKAIRLEFECEKGKIEVENVKINSKEIILNYLLLPSDFVFKLKDSIHFSTSIQDRLIYIQDSIKIVTKSAKNFLIGVGGEGFKYLYPIVQEKVYSSTEVHNIYMQIFVESGIIGVSVFLVICIFSILKSKKSIYKICLVIFLIHSFFDLNFSYMFMLAIFAVLLGLNRDNDISSNKYFKFKKVIYILENAFAILMFCITSVILFRANMTYYMNISKIDKLNFNYNMQYVNNLEKRTKLDPYEIKYRLELNEGYANYLNLLKEQLNNNEHNKDEQKILQNEIKNVISNIKENADIMLKYDKYNSDTVINVCNIYFNNIYNFTKIYYSTDLNNGYNEYINWILKQLENLKENYKYKEKVQIKINELYEKYQGEFKNMNILYDLTVPSIN